MTGVLIVALFAASAALGLYAIGATWMQQAAAIRALPSLLRTAPQTRELRYRMIEHVNWKMQPAATQATILRPNFRPALPLHALRAAA